MHSKLRRTRFFQSLRQPFRPQSWGADRAHRLQRKTCHALGREPIRDPFNCLNLSCEEWVGVLVACKGSLHKARPSSINVCLPIWPRDRHLVLRPCIDRAMKSFLRAHFIVAGCLFPLAIAADLGLGPSSVSEHRIKAAPTPCQPSYFLLEQSPEFRKSQGARTSLAIVGCEEDLRRATAQQLAEIESELLARAGKSGWGGMIRDEERAWARTRVASILGVPAPVDVFYFTSR